MAHGQDVANLGTVPGVSAATRMVVSRAEALICNSSWLLDRLVEKIPAARAKSTVADCGIDLDSFAPLEAAGGTRRDPSGTAPVPASSASAP